MGLKLTSTRVFSLKPVAKTIYLSWRQGRLNQPLEGQEEEIKTISKLSNSQIMKERIFLETVCNPASNSVLVLLLISHLITLLSEAKSVNIKQN
jgi:hypothetical protein